MHSSAAHLQLATDERRRRSRLPANTVGWVILENGSSEPWEVHVKDVTRNGAAFETFEPLRKGEVCRLRIGRGPIELARMVRVVHCTAGQGGVHFVGAAFI